MFNKSTFLTVLFAAAAAVSSFAQSSASATQTIHIQVAPIIQIGNNGNGKGLGLGNLLNNNNGNNGNGNNGNNGNGNNGNGNGNGNKMKDNSNDFREFTVNSNKGFIVSVQSTNDNADENILLALAENKTGGQANPTFTGSYAPVHTTTQDLLMNCQYGAEKTFAVNYRAKNNKAKKQGLTKADLIYTATLP